MLHERTSSAINLRMQSGRRHAIRNLKAKVRALLPVDTCPRQRKRKHRSQKIDVTTHSRSYFYDESKHFESMQKKRNIIFEKLTRDEIEQINENKHYFLDKEQSIAFYEGYVREAYPEMVDHEWIVPQSQTKQLLQFAFIPSSLINPSEITSKKLTSEKRLLQKRNSGSKSVGILRRTSIPLQESPFPFSQTIVNNKNKASACLSRKHAQQEQQKIKREINSVHLQRSQQVAVAKRQKYLKQKVESAKMQYASTHLRKYDQSRWGAQRWMQNDIKDLASQLRKVCLHRKKQSLSDQPIL